MNDTEAKRAKQWIAAQRQAAKEAKRAMKKRVQRAQAAARRADDAAEAAEAAAASKKLTGAGRAAALDVLGCTVDSSPAEVRSAYRRLALQWHPDKNQAAGATEMFQRIQTAWMELGSVEGS